ncbi:hypothetical protein 97L [Ranavirus ambystoma1]|uniref:Uncharacterized protein n=1 Tax=Ranavirus ambystoma1 TaxID=265294 RepID=A0A0U2RQT7_9VIRU|nr:hypothetical protein 97L [Ambystoma tigrinum virus]ALN37198.1 hypothetical protein 96L [Ambystoma tigrinum virus]
MANFVTFSSMTWYRLPWPLTTSMTFVSTKSITKFCVFAIVLVAAQMLR